MITENWDNIPVFSLSTSIEVCSLWQHVIIGFRHWLGAVMENKPLLESMMNFDSLKYICVTRPWCVKRLKTIRKWYMYGWSLFKWFQISTHLGLVTPYGVLNGQNLLWYWFVTCLMSSHCLNQCWPKLVLNDMQWNFQPESKTFLSIKYIWLCLTEIWQPFDPIINVFLTKYCTNGEISTSFSYQPPVLGKCWHGLKVNWV